MKHRTKKPVIAELEGLARLQVCEQSTANDEECDTNFNTVGCVCLKEMIHLYSTTLTPPEIITLFFSK